MYFQDAGRPEWECVSQVELGLGDVNDNRPMWDQEEFLTNVPEDAVVGGIVTKVHAIDLDLGDNRKVSYSLLKSDSDHFKVDSRTGIVSLTRTLDREIRDSFNLSVRAMDSGRPRLTAVTSLVVRVAGELCRGNNDTTAHNPCYPSRIHLYCSTCRCFLIAPMVVIFVAREHGNINTLSPVLMSQ